jgi:hypothetical protein
MAKSNPYAWPARPSFLFRNARGKVYFTSQDRKLDLSDSLMHTANNRTVYLQFSTKAKDWVYWTDERIKTIEERIHYDLEFDGYRVKVDFLGPIPDELPCSEDVCWKLTIRST